MQTVRSWKLSDFATPRGFGDCRWAGTVWNENKGRGLGRELGKGRLGRSLNAQAPGGSAPRYLAVRSACDLTWVQASLPSTPRPAVAKWPSARTWRARPGPVSLGLQPHGPSGAEPGAAGTGSCIEKMLRSLGPRTGIASWESKLEDLQQA